MGITSSRALAGCEGTEGRYRCGRARGVSRIGAGLVRPPPVEDEVHYWAECPSLRPARLRMLEELDGAYPGFVRRYEALPRLEKGRALAFGVPDGM